MDVCGCDRCEGCKCMSQSVCGEYVSVCKHMYKCKREKRPVLITVTGSVWLEIVWLSLPSSLITEQLKFEV